MKLTYIQVALLSSIFTCLVCLTIYKYVSEPTTIIVQTTYPESKTVNQQPITPGPETFDFNNVLKSVVQIKVARLHDNQYNIDNGSGMVVDKENGYILTSYHVVESAQKIEIITYTGKKLNADVFAFDAFSDIAILSVDALLEEEVVFADSDQLTLGESIYAIGSPFDLQGTLTSGIVSSRLREIKLADIGLDLFLQTDAAINPGNSGGALINSRGQVVGMVAAILSEDGYYQGYSFAIHSNIIQKLLDDLESYGSLQRAQLGIAFQIEFDRFGKSIYRVSDSKSIENQGLKQNDVLVAIDGYYINDKTFLKKYLFQKSPGENVMLTVIRDDRQMQIEVPLLNEFNTSDKIYRNQMDHFRTLGMEVRSLTTKEKEMSGYEGIKVISIVKGSPTDVAQIQPNFIITHIEDKPVEGDLEKINEKIKTLDVIELKGVYMEYPGIYPYKIQTAAKGNSSIRRY